MITKFGNEYFLRMLMMIFRPVAMTIVALGLLSFQLNAFPLVGLKDAYSMDKIIMEAQTVFLGTITEFVATKTQDYIVDRAYNPSSRSFASYTVRVDRVIFGSPQFKNQSFSDVIPYREEDTSIQLGQTGLFLYGPISPNGLPKPIRIPSVNQSFAVVSDRKDLVKLISSEVVDALKSDLAQSDRDLSNSPAIKAAIIKRDYHLLDTVETFQPILNPDQAELVVNPLLRIKNLDRYGEPYGYILKLRALNLLMRTTSKPQYLQIATQEFQNAVSSGDLKACNYCVGFFGFGSSKCLKGESEEGCVERINAFKPLFREVAQQNEHGERLAWECGMEPLLRSGSAEDLPVLSAALNQTGVRRQEAYDRIAQILGMSTPAAKNMNEEADFEREVDRKLKERLSANVQVGL